MAGAGLQPLNIFLIVFPLVVSFVIVAIRVWRKIKEHQFAIEDTLLVTAEILLAALTATVWKYVIVSYSGYRAEDIPEEAINMVDVFLWRYINNAIYNPILGLVKISFLITLLKLRSRNRLIIVSLWALIVVNAFFIVAATCGSVFMCRPIHKYWHKNAPGTCANAPQYIYGVIGVTIATDVLVALIPAWILYDLQMSMKNKIGVIPFLSLPLAVTAIGCYRLHMFVVIFSLPPGSVEDPYNVRNALSNIEGRFIPYFDTARTKNPYTPNPSSHLRQDSHGYVKSNGDLELQPDGLKHSYPRNVRNSCWKNVGDNDADSEEQCITVGPDKDIRKTTVVEWEIEEVHTPSPTSNSKVGVPKSPFHYGT